MCYAPLPAAPIGEGQLPEAIEGMQPPPGREAMATLVVEAAGEGLGGIASRVAEADYGPEPTEDHEMVALESFEEGRAVEEAAPAAVDLPVEELTEAPAEQPPEELEEAEEEYVPPPPPPGVVGLEEEVGEEGIEEMPPAPPAPEKPAGDEWTINQE